MNSDNIFNNMRDNSNNQNNNQPHQFIVNGQLMSEEEVMYLYQMQQQMQYDQEEESESDQQFHDSRVVKTVRSLKRQK